MKPCLASEMLCTGCTACMASCTHGAISMLPDRLGFLRPIVNETLCVGCGKCEKSCPVLSGRKRQFPLKCLAARTKDCDLLVHSSSGGVFSELSKSVIATGGVVYGCVLDGLLKVVHVRANTIEQIAPMRGSKYVQSDLKNVYAMTRHDLDNGIQVLFTGTPCQILGLISFLNKPYDNLITVGLICHGVPSPELFEYYKRSETQKVHDDLVNITFRDKHFSWREFAIALEFSNSNNNAYISQWSGSYMCLFNRNYLMRESCFHCPARTGMSGCDIVIGDFWGVEREHPELDSSKGYSCVLVYTPKGLRLIESSSMEMTETTYRKVIRANVNVEDNPRRPYGIEYFRMNYKLKPFDEWTDWVFWGPWWFRMLCPVLHWQEFKIRYVRTAYRWFRRLLLGDR